MILQYCLDLDLVIVVPRIMLGIAYAKSQTLLSIAASFARSQNIFKAAVSCKKSLCGVGGPLFGIYRSRL